MTSDRLPPDAKTLDGGFGDTAIASGKNSGTVPALLPGGTIGRYVIRDAIGEGGMGVIYTAFDPQLEREIAVKLLRSTAANGADDSFGQARLLREAQAMAQLSHPNVLPVYDVGTHGSSVFVAMELVRGSNLARWLQLEPRTWRQVLDVFIQAGHGLAAAHSAGLVHRDFKPANVLVGADNRARVADFGIARSTRVSEKTRPAAELASESGRVVSLDTPLTQAGALMGSPGYMSPEQYAGVATSPATDQFSFCIALYEALYGARPFGGKTLPELAHTTHLGKVPAPPKGSLVPPWLFPVIVKGLSVDPLSRHASMAALLAALTKDPAKVLRRRVATGAVVFVLVAISGTLVYLQQQQAQVCRGADAMLEGVWDAGLAQRGREAFAATGKSYAASSWQSVSAGLDAYAKRWVASRIETCEATRIRGEQTDTQLLLRTTCLDRRLDELGALAGAFAVADTSVVDQSAAAVAKLTPLEGCANLKGLEARRQVPAESREAVARVGQAVAQARALVATGKFAAAREKLAPALAEAAALKLPGPQAETQAQLGELERESANWALARDAYERAVQFAQAGADDATSASVLNALVSLIGWRLERPAEGRTLAAISAGIIERLGGDERLEAQLNEGLGDAEWQAGDRVASLVRYHQALATVIRLEGAETPDVARLRSAIGWVLMEQGELDEARRELELSRTIREKLLGKEHPSLSATWNELGSLFDSLGDYAESVRCMERGLKIEMLSQEDDSIAIVRRKLGLANALRRAGRAAEGFVYLRQSEATALRHPEARSSVSFQLQRIAGTLEAAVGRHEEAARMLKAAVANFEVISGKDHPYVTQLAVDYGRSLMSLKKYEEALENFDRFIVSELRLGGKSPELALVYADSARATAALGRPADALARFEKAAALMPIERHPAAPGIHFELARAMWASEPARAKDLAVAARKKMVPGKEADGADAWLAKH